MYKYLFFQQKSNKFIKNNPFYQLSLTFFENS